MSEDTTEQSGMSGGKSNVISHQIRFVDYDARGYTAPPQSVLDVVVCTRCGVMVAKLFMDQHDHHHGVLNRIAQRVLGFPW